jgi:hypothetical protein
VPEGAEAVLAVRKLQELKKQLPTLITTWVKKRWGEERAGGTCRGELRAVRQTSLDRAKVSVWLSVLDKKGKPVPERDEILVIYLHYYGGSWTSSRFEGTWPTKKDYNKKAARFLMMAIDER